METVRAYCLMVDVWSLLCADVAARCFFFFFFFCFFLADFFVSVMHSGVNEGARLRALLSAKTTMVATLEERNTKLRERIAILVNDRETSLSLQRQLEHEVWHRL